MTVTAVVYCSAVLTEHRGPWSSPTETSERRAAAEPAPERWSPFSACFWRISEEREKKWFPTSWYSARSLKCRRKTLVKSEPSWKIKKRKASNVQYKVWASRCNRIEEKSILLWLSGCGRREWPPLVRSLVTHSRAAVSTSDSDHKWSCLERF